MKDIHFSVKPAANAKSQALDVIRKLQETIPLQRASMSVRICLPQKDAKRVKAAIVALVLSVDEEDWDGDLEMVRAWH